MTHSCTPELPDQFRDRDIFQDSKGLLFVTLGHIQPRDRVLSYLKYVPDTDGRWSTPTTRYRRIFWGDVNSVVGGMDLLPSSYMVEDDHFQTTLIEPPHDMIATYYNPELRLSEILEAPHDELEELTKETAETIHDELGIPLSVLGVAGSILWKGHSIVHSDINMNIYGRSQSWELQTNYEHLDESIHHTRLRAPKEWQPAIERVHKRIPVLSRKSVEQLFTRRRAIYIRDRCIGITPVLLPTEAPIAYGSETYVTYSFEPVKLTAMIEDDEYGIFHPALYQISPLSPEDKMIQRIMVYDGAFTGLFRSGDRVEISGMLQRVVKKSGEGSFHQIMVGTKIGAGKEYIRLLK